MLLCNLPADFQPNGEAPVSASAIAIDGKLMTPDGPKPYTVPRALDEAELPGLIEDYRKGARNALDAGFDGAAPPRCIPTTKTLLGAHWMRFQRNCILQTPFAAQEQDDYLIVSATFTAVEASFQPDCAMLRSCIAWQWR